MRRSIVCAALLLAGCINVADERALAEEQVGRQTGSGLDVTIVDGHASIRALEPGRIELWGQAPSLDVVLEADVAGEWLLEARNVMPSVELSGATATLESQPLPTRKTWRMQLEAGTNTLRIAAPDAQTAEAYRIIMFADVQDAIEGVQDLYVRMAEEPDVHFGLISGDLTDFGSVEELERFQLEMATLPFPLFATLGNHELGNGSITPPFHRLFGRGSYSFVYRGVRFTLLDSGTGTIAVTTYDLLERWLDDGSDQLHLVMTHMPPLDTAGLRNNAFGDRNEAHKLLGMLADHAVDMTVYGHVHSYSNFENVGIEAHISGGGGGIQERLDGISRHFLSVQVEPQQERFTTSVVRVPD